MGGGGFLLVFAFSLQAERGETPLVTGLLHMPFRLGAMLGIGLIGRRFLPRYGRWVLVVGAVLMALAVVSLIAAIGLTTLNWPALTPSLVLAGAGMGMLSGCISPVAVAQVDRDHAGAASGLLKTSQQLGAALGVALAGSIYFAWSGHPGVPPSLAAVTGIEVLLVTCALLAMRLPADIFGQKSR